MFRANNPWLGCRPHTADKTDLITVEYYDSCQTRTVVFNDAAQYIRTKQAHCIFIKPDSAYLKELKTYPILVCLYNPTGPYVFNNKHNNNNINTNEYESF